MNAFRFFGLLICFCLASACSSSKSQSTQSGGTKYIVNADNVNGIVDSYSSALGDWWSRNRGVRAATPTPLEEAPFSGRAACSEFSDAPQLQGAGIEVGPGISSGFQSFQDQIANDAGAVITDSKVAAWVKDGGKGEPPPVKFPSSGEILSSCATGANPTPSADNSRTVGPVVGGGAVCQRPMFPCSLLGAGGCCRRCFAPICYGQYQNGVMCVGNNNPATWWAWCNGNPAGGIAQWSCPCRN